VTILCYTCLFLSLFFFSLALCTIWQSTKPTKPTKCAECGKELTEEELSSKFNTEYTNQMCSDCMNNDITEPQYEIK